MALQQAMMGLTNERDLGELNANTQRDIAAMQASAAGGGGVDPATQQLQAVGLMLDALKLGFGTQTEMSGQMNQTQLGALGNALGMGNLDMNRLMGASGIGQGLGLGGLNFGFGVNQAEQARQRAEANDAWERQMYGDEQERQSLMDLMNMMGMFGSMGSDSWGSGGGYIPSGASNNSQAIMGLLGGFLQGWGGTKQAMR